MSNLELKFSLDGRNKLLSFVDEDTLLAYSSAGVLFLKVESGEFSVFRPTGLRNVDIAAVHSEYHLFAVAERGISPKLQVFQYPECKQLSTMEGVAQLEYLQMAFSNAVYLAACTGLPEFKIAVWDVYSGAKLVEADYDMDVHPACIAFNPGNWHQLSIVGAETGRITLWNIEQSSKIFLLRRSDVRLPFVGDLVSAAPEETKTMAFSPRDGANAISSSPIEKPQQPIADGTSASLVSNLTNTQQLNKVEIPRFAMAGLVQPFAEEFEVEPFDRTRFFATSVAFNGKNELFVACKSGHLLAVTFAATYDAVATTEAQGSTFTPRTANRTRFSYGFRCVLRPTDTENVDSDRVPTADDVWRPHPGDMDHVLVHGLGIVCVGNKTGLIRVVQPSAPYKLLCELDTGAVGLSTACFSPHYDHLAILTTTRSVLLLPDFAQALPQVELTREFSGNKDEGVEQHPPRTLYTLNVKELPGVNALAENQRNAALFKKPFVSNFHFGNGRAIGIEPVGTEPDVAVVVTSGGCVQTWDISSNLRQMSALFLPKREDGTEFEWSILASCPAFRLAVAGTLTGELHFIDLSSLQYPRLVAVVRLSRRAVVGLKFDPYANLLVAITADNVLFLIDPRPLKSFQVIGYTTLPGDLVPNAFSVLSTADGVEGKVSVAMGYQPQGETIMPAQARLALRNQPQVQKPKSELEFNKVVLYQLDAVKLKQTADDLYIHPIRRELKEASVGRLLVTLSTTSTGLVLVDHHRMCTLVADSGRLANFSLSALISTVLPPTPSTVSSDGTPSTAASSEILQPVDYGNTGAGELPVATGLSRSSDAKWLLITCNDGHVIVVNPDDQTHSQAMSIAPPVDPRFGGIIRSTVVSSGDNRYLMAAGRDGSAVILQFGFTRTTSGRSTRSSEQSGPLGWAVGSEDCRRIFENWRNKCRELASREVRILESMPVYMPTKKQEADPKAKAAEEKAATRRAKESPYGPSFYEVQPINLPSDATAVETLTAKAIHADDERVLDTKSHLLLALVKIRERLHTMMVDNQNKPDLEKLDHQEFDLDAAEQARLLQEGDAAAKKMKQQLEAEIASRLTYIARIKRECLDTLKIKSKVIRGMTSQLRVNNYPLKEKTPDELAALDMIRKIREIELAEFKTRASDKPAVTLADHAGGAEEGEASATGGGGSAGGGDGPVDGSEDVVVPTNKEQAMHQQGSFATQFGADCSLHYDQFSLQTRDQKLCQIALIKDAVYSIKEAFNREFEEACRRKENEMSKITERNRRLRQIQDLLEVFDKRPVSENLVQYEPNSGIGEDTEQLFTVADSDVPAEKWISPAERKKREEAEKAENERLIRERGDNPRERGLMDMMGGVLEVKKEDELRKEIAMPNFIAEGKPESEWNEEEVKIAMDYTKKSKELADERDKYRKVVDVEAKRLRQQVAESVATYEELLSELFKRKLKTEMTIYQEELKISRIQLELVVEASFVVQIEELRRRLETKRSELLHAQKNVADARKLLSETQENYDVLVAEDKILEKGFRREFADVNSQHADLLVRQFRRRPKGIKTGPQLVQAMAHAAGPGNPFAERPSTATQQQQVNAQLESALVELDRESNCPEGIEPHIWKRLCDYRRQKIEKEFKIKEQALLQADSQAFLQHRLQDEETHRQDIDKLAEDVARFEGELERFLLNLEVQLVVKQGQVEVKKSCPECPLILEFDDAILVHRGVVEQLNSCILQKGGQKIANMERAKKTKRDIFRLEWEHRRLQMEMTDLDQKIHDIDHLRLTREVQGYLFTSDYDSKIQKELAQLEQTLVAQQQYHAKAMERLKKLMGDVERTHGQREDSNFAYDGELDLLNLKVCEQRRMVEVTSGELEVDAARRRRIAAVVNRSRLVEVARAQASEIAVLRQEVERLRLKTFPALVQLD